MDLGAESAAAHVSSRVYIRRSRSSQRQSQSRLICGHRVESASVYLAARPLQSRARVAHPTAAVRFTHPMYFTILAKRATAGNCETGDSKAEEKMRKVQRAGTCLAVDECSGDAVINILFRKDGSFLVGSSAGVPVGCKTEDTCAVGESSFACPSSYIQEQINVWSIRDRAIRDRMDGDFNRRLLASTIGVVIGHEAEVGSTYRETTSCWNHVKTQGRSPRQRVLQSWTFDLTNLMFQGYIGDDYPHQLLLDVPLFALTTEDSERYTLSDFNANGDSKSESQPRNPAQWNDTRSEGSQIPPQRDDTRPDEMSANQMCKDKRVTSGSLHAKFKRKGQYTRRKV
ncbi:hypothetical protein C8R45DRAFT_926692 [Mycena sanguinolenta]|nr:hypothetical protein C8R45DRAFT_926692 [Mycena sanguinolenta]